MSDTRQLERLLADFMASAASERAPVEAVEAAIETSRQGRPRPTWLAMLRTPPMTTERQPLVGSPTGRFIYLAATLLLATVVATAGLLVGAQLADANEHATNGLIAFDSEGDIWVAEADGSNVRRVTDDPAMERLPVWSPDGSRIAFLVDRAPGRQDLVHVDAAGGDRVVVARGLVIPGFFPQSWSPDSRQLTYSAYIDGGSPRVFVAQADGSGTAQIGDPGLVARDPAWSADGRSIAFVGGNNTTAPQEPTDSAKHGVYVMNADGSDVRLVSQASDLASISMPQWSPDSSAIVTHAGEVIADVWVFRADGQEETMISDGDSDNYWATWSPDGAWVAWDHQSNGDGVRTAIAAPAGTDRYVLDEPYLNGWEPVWSPDSTRIVVHLGPDEASPDVWSRNRGEHDLAIVDPLGQAPITLISVSGPGGVSWQRLTR